MALVKTPARIGFPEGFWNPGICRVRGKVLVAARLDARSGHHHKPKVYIAELMPDASIRRLTLLVEYAEDPRLFTVAGKLYCAYTTSPRERGSQKNHMGVCRIAKGWKAVEHREFRRARKPQKNWQFFDYEGKMHAVYWIAPHQVLKCAKGDRKLPIVRAGKQRLRCSEKLKYKLGGTPPVRFGELYYSFFHCWHAKFKLPGNLRLSHAKRFYYTGAYAFEARPPFRIKLITPEPILEPRGRDTLIQFVSGAIYTRGTWYLSYGLQDRECHLMSIGHKELLSKMRKVR
jgi:predicted GH43/DUF377 family glycosyl hydrolase